MNLRWESEKIKIRSDQMIIIQIKSNDENRKQTVSGEYPVSSIELGTDQFDSYTYDPKKSKITDKHEVKFRSDEDPLAPVQCIPLIAYPRIHRMSRPQGVGNNHLTFLPILCPTGRTRASSRHAWSPSSPATASSPAACPSESTSTRWPTSSSLSRGRARGATSTASAPRLPSPSARRPATRSSRAFGTPCTRTRGTLPWCRRLGRFGSCPQRCLGWVVTLASCSTALTSR